jgi:hypothetical protein
MLVKDFFSGWNGGDRNKRQELWVRVRPKGRGSSSARGGLRRMPFLSLLTRQHFKVYRYRAPVVHCYTYDSRAPSLGDGQLRGTESGAPWQRERGSVAERAGLRVGESGAHSLGAYGLRGAEFTTPSLGALLAHVSVAPNSGASMYSRSDHSTRGYHPWLNTVVRRRRTLRLL